MLIARLANLRKLSNMMTYAVPAKYLADLPYRIRKNDYVRPICVDYRSSSVNPMSMYWGDGVETPLRRDLSVAPDTTVYLFSEDPVDLVSGPTHTLSALIMVPPFVRMISGNAYSIGVACVTAVNISDCYDQLRGAAWP